MDTLLGILLSECKRMCGYAIGMGHIAASNQRKTHEIVPPHKPSEWFV
jgi:hypothetical protein